MIPVREPDHEAGQRETSGRTLVPAWCPTPGRFANGETGEMRVAPCKRRMCAWCGPAMYVPDKLARMLRGMSWAGHRYYLLTLTAPGMCDDTCAGKASHSNGCMARCSRWNLRAGERWKRFTVLLRRLLPGADVEFFKTWELQSRKALHAHVIVRLGGKVHLPVGVLRKLAERAGFGPVLDWRTADKGAARYLAKYLTKSMGEAAAPRSPQGRGVLATPRPGRKTNARPWSDSGKWVIRMDAELYGGGKLHQGIWLRPEPRQEGSPWRWMGLERPPPTSSG